MTLGNKLQQLCCTFLNSDIFYLNDSWSERSDITHLFFILFSHREKPLAFFRVNRCKTVTSSPFSFFSHFFPLSFPYVPHILCLPSFSDSPYLFSFRVLLLPPLLLFYCPFLFPSLFLKVSSIRRDSAAISSQKTNRELLLPRRSTYPFSLSPPLRIKTSVGLELHLYVWRREDHGWCREANNFRGLIWFVAFWERSGNIPHRDYIRIFI